MRNSEPKDTGAAPERAALGASAVAALLAGTCCLAPLALVSAGVGGAWLADFRLLEPYRPLFLAISTVALAFAWKRIYRPACAPGEACAVPGMKRTMRIAFWSAVALLAAMFAYPYFLPLFY